MVYGDVIEHFVFLFNVSASTDINTLSLHDALPIFTVRTVMVTSTALRDALLHRVREQTGVRGLTFEVEPTPLTGGFWAEDRKSTRLNSSHGYISYAAFCLKNKTANNIDILHCKLSW